MSSTVLINKDLVAVRVGYRKTRGTLRTLIAFGEACNALALHVALKISARAAHSELRMQAARKTQCNARTRSAVRHEHWSTHHHRKCVAPRCVISQLIACPPTQRLAAVATAPGQADHAAPRIRQYATAAMARAARATQSAVTTRPTWALYPPTARASNRKLTTLVAAATSATPCSAG